MSKVGAYLSCGVARAVFYCWVFYRAFLGSLCPMVVDASWAVIRLLNKVALALSSFLGRPNLWHSATGVLRVILFKLLAMLALA